MSTEDKPSIVPRVPHDQMRKPPVRTRKTKTRLQQLLFFSSLWFVVPIALSRIVVGASWTAIGYAYLIWFGLLGLWGLSIKRKGTAGEAVGWPLILSMFWTFPAIPILATIMRASGYD